MIVIQKLNNAANWKLDSIEFEGFHGQSENNVNGDNNSIVVIGSV